MPPHSPRPSPRSGNVDTIASEIKDADQQHLILGGIMALSLMVLWLTNGSPPAEPGILAFADSGFSTNTIVIVLACGLWARGCTAIRRGSLSSRG